MVKKRSDVVYARHRKPGHATGGAETDSPRWRFEWHRLVFVMTIVFALSIAAGIDGAGAYRGWCRADPQFQIQGELVRVTVAAQVHDMRAARELSTDPIIVVLTVPVGIRIEHLASNNGFGYGFDVMIEHSPDLETTDQGIPVRVAVYVPMTDSTVPIRIAFVPAGSAGQAKGDLELGGGADKNGRRRVLAPGSAIGTANDWIELET